MQHKMVLNLTIMGETLMCDHSKSNHWAVLSPIVLLIMLCEANVTFDFFTLMDEILLLPILASLISWKPGAKVAKSTSHSLYQPLYL